MGYKKDVLTQAWERLNAQRRRWQHSQGVPAEYTREECATKWKNGASHASAFYKGVRASLAKVRGGLLRGRCLR